MQNSKCKMNSLRCAAIMALACGALFAAGAGDILATLPAKTPAEGQALAAELIKLGPAGVKEVCAKLTDPSAGDDSKARFGLHGMAMQAMRPEAEAERAMLEAGILEALPGAATPEVKAFLVEQLKYIGKNASVAPLSGFLADERLCEPATQSLLVIRTPDAAAALAKALPDAKGKNLVTVIRALGELREKSVAKAILPHAASDDATLRQAAWFALANIGDASAAEALAKAADIKGTYEQSVGIANYLLLAKRLGEAGDKDGAAKICRGLMATRTTPRSHVYSAALCTLAGAVGAAALPEVLTAVDNQDLKIREAALQLLGSIEGPEVTTQLVAKLKAASPEARATIIRMLGRRSDKAALGAVIEALKDTEKAVRLAAIPAVAALGGADAVAPLLAVMDAGQAEEIQSAREAFMSMKGEGLTAAVGAAAAKAAPAVKATLLDVLAARGATDQAAVVLEAAGDKDPTVAAAALRALPSVVGADNAPRLVEMLLAAPDAVKRAELGKAVVAACRKAGGPAAALTALANAKGEGRAELLKVLARLGGDQAVQAVLADAKNDDAATREAAIRALGEWCDAAPAAALLGLAREAKEQVHHVLAMRAYMRLVSLPSSRTPEQTVDLFKQALSGAQSADDKKLVLGGLSSIHHADAATLAASCLDDAVVKGEAAAAIITIICPSSDGEKGLPGPAMAALIEKAATATTVAALQKKAQSYLGSQPRVAPAGGEVNLALNKPVKTNVGQEGGNAPEKAVDGNTDRDAAWFGQKWPCWLEVDLQKPEKIEAAHVFFYDDGGRYYQYAVEVSTDQKEYKQVVDMKANTTPANANGVLSKFEPIEARYVRINITKNSANQAVHLAEIKVYPAGKVPAFAPAGPKADAGEPTPTTPLAAPDKDGFIPLFNGKDLTGWTGSVKGYGAENGVIYCDPKTGGNLYTEHEFADFIFRFEFKLPPGANNGVGIRAPLKGDAAYQAMEIQVLDDTAKEYEKLQPFQYHGSVYGLVAAKKGFQKPVGEWNEEEIQAIGRKIKVTLNGTVIVDCDLDEVKKLAKPEVIKAHPGMDNRKGHIGWLGHGARVEFRNIRIKPIQPAEPYTAGPHNVPPEGFTALFNGKDMSGWKGLVQDPPKRAKMTPEALAAAEKKATEEALKHWKAEDGVIVYDGKNNSLCTEKDYGDFEMYVDWKIGTHGDSGIYIRGSPQVQIWDPAQWPVGSGGLYNNQKNPSKPSKCADNPIGQWNRFHIKMVGEKVWVWLNEELVVDNVTMENYWERGKPIYPTGQIELQHHGSTLWFRNIYIKELK